MFCKYIPLFLGLILLSVPTYKKKKKKMHCGRWQVFIPSGVENVSELTGVVYAVKAKCFVFLPYHPVL